MPPKGGAEAQAQARRFEYNANSNLVLTTDAKPRDSSEPSGEPQSLAGRIDPKQMGDRFAPQQPEKPKKSQSKKRDADANQVQQAAKHPRTASSVLDVTSEFYTPKTRETRAAYEALLNIVKRQFGDQPEDVLRGAAEELLASLKNEKLSDPERRREIEALTGRISESDFARMVSLGKLITDFTHSDAAAMGQTHAQQQQQDNFDDEIGVAVEFDENEDEEEGADAAAGSGMADTVQEEDEMDNQTQQSMPEQKQQVYDGDSGPAANAYGSEDATMGDEVHGMQLEDDNVAGASGGAGVDDDHEDPYAIRVADIDAYWLQRQVGRAFNFSDSEAHRARELANSVFTILQGDADRREAENQLVQLLQFEKFELVKTLLKNRMRIVWCIKLGRAENEEQRQAVEDEMRADDEGAEILRILHDSRGTARERQSKVERNIRQEARKLREQTGNRRGKTTDAEAAAAGRRLLELESLTFSQGSHLMSNRRCELPSGSYRTSKKGYEEVYVPAQKPMPMSDNEHLVSVNEMPAWAQPAFENMQRLNRIQSRVYEAALYSPENLLLCAPTGSGKTNVALLTILHEIAKHMYPDGTINLADFKVVYVAPMKALVSEMVDNFSNRLQHFGIMVRELTGDITLSKQEVDETQIIVTTPEKWDIITRKAGDRSYTDLARLLIIDEVHLLHDTRGPVLESIISRTVRQVESTQELTRIVGLSATLPNYEDVALFMKVDPDKGLFVFDSSYRPCPLEQQFVGVSVKKPLQRIQLMNEICHEKVMHHAGINQVLIFVHSRKETAKTAKYIRDTAMQNAETEKFVREGSGTSEVLKSEAEGAKNSDLRNLLSYGIAIHHAGLSRSDRTLVEDLFADKQIQVLVSTATLAWGINLPAHTVIIKGTQVYSPERGNWEELSPLDVQQMMGRAGRPQFDSYGEGIIITGHGELQFYLSLLNQQLPVESQFVSRLADNLNAELILGTIQNTKEAAIWLSYTYLYIRMLRNPTLYSVPVDELDEDPALEARRADLIHTAAHRLDKSGLIRYDRRTGVLLANEIGRVAAHYYVTHRTVHAFNEHLKPSMGDIELLRVFTLAEEFKNITVREDEKLELARLLERVPIPIKEGVEEPSAKINVLLQAYISNMTLEGFSLMSDMVYITQSAGRILRCIFELIIKKGWALLASKALTLSKCATHKMWSSQTPLRQFKGLNNDTLIKIERKDQLSWEHICEMSPQEIGELIRYPQLGKAIHKLVHQLPKMHMQAHVQPITRAVLKVDLSITPDFRWDSKVHGRVEPFWIIVEDSDSEKVLHFEYFLLRDINAEDDHFLSFTVPLQEPLPPQYFVKLASDRWIGSETVLPVPFKHLILPEKAPPTTELLDLQPLQVSALKSKEFQALYENVKHFNAIQTQTFSALYKSDDNVLLAAPSGSGKSTCGEFAMLKAFKDNPAARIVYMAPLDTLAERRYNDWCKRFGEGLGKDVEMLVGENASDLKALERAHILITNPKNWDQLSRRWKQRKNVQNVDLFLMDNLHLIGSEPGPTLEICCSRMRYIGAQTEKNIRIVGLSNAISNAKDLGEWIGASGSSIFNFDPGVRPLPLHVEVTGLDIAGFEARMQAMSRPAFSAITSHATNKKQAILFLPTRKHAKLAAFDMLTHASVEENPYRFLKCTPDDIQTAVDSLTDKASKHALSYGICLMHDSLPEREKSVLETAFSSGAAQILVATASMCWRVRHEAHVVLIMGTQYYDSSGRGGTDYPITDLVEMAGRANCVEEASDACKVVLFCHAPRKEYYKKFLYDPLPVESHLNHYLHDHMASEVTLRTIENKQDAVDYLTWTFMYRRLMKNPNYYNMTGTSHRHVSDFLSELVEGTVADLEQSKVIAVEDDYDLSPLNLGMIAAYYYITYTTIEVFSRSLTAKSKLKGMLDILCSATEFDTLPMRPGEEDATRAILRHSPLSLETPRYDEPHTKAHALLQAHFSRRTLSGDMALDKRNVVLASLRLLGAMVDVIASSGWLNPALAAMEMCQMVVQGMWAKESPLLQLPHVTEELAQRAKDHGIESVFDLLEMDDADRRALLNMSEQQLEEVAQVCNRYPSIELSYEVEEQDDILVGDDVTMQISLEREIEEELRPVDAPRFPKQKDEAWWLVIGHAKSNQLLAIKRVTFQYRTKVKLAFSAPESAGRHDLTLFFMCDSYLGCDQELEVPLDVKEAQADENEAMKEE